MKRFITIFCIAILLLLALSIIYYKNFYLQPQATDIETISDDQTKQPLNEESTNNFEDALGLALKGINLVQGENGVELWRLKASWAQISHDGDTIEVDSPVVNYMLGDGSKDDNIQVSADKGKITDKQRTILLWGNIVITQDQKSITGPLMNYDADTRILTFPDSVKFYSPVAIGSAPKVTWNLETNIIKATGGVKAILNIGKNTQLNK